MTVTSLNYDYQARRLAVGIELEDYLRETELICPVRAEIEHVVPHKKPEPAKHYAFSQSEILPKGLLRSGTGRYSLSYYPGVKEQIDVRIYDYERCYVPRRLRVPLRTLADVIAREEAEVENYMEGLHRDVVMFPGSSYHLLSNATGLRGRVLRDGQVMRWAYVSATLEGSARVIARARGDERGEFLLILPPESAPASDLSSTLSIDVSVSGPTVEPVPINENLPDQDSLWDLPLEEIPAIGLADTVSNGKSLPAGYSTMSPRTIEFSVGRILTGRDEPDFNFVVP